MASNDFLPFTRPAIDEATIAAVGEVLRSGWITSGPKVRAFEAQLSEMFGGRPVRSMSSATGAMEIALALAGVGAGDEVITTPMSWVSTANVVLRAGARPVFVDCDPRTRNIDLERVEAAITPRTRAIFPVDLAGLPVDRDRLYAIARAHKLRVIEDAAQSMGANWRGRMIGSTGDLVSISFHANKNITSAEGGCLVLNDEDEARRCELWRLQGARKQGDSWDGMDVTLAGGKHNMTDIAACIGLGQLPRLAAFTARRRELARRYFARFDRTLGCELPLEDYAQSNWHMFQVLLPAGAVRAVFISAMRATGIGVGVHYPAIHLFTLFRQLGHKAGEFPHAERIGDRTVSLPMFPAMADGDVDRVLAAMPSALAAALSAGEAAVAGSKAGMSIASVELSVVIPVYNEEASLPALYARLYPALDALNRSYEIIFVNDGSRDRSAALLREQFELRPDVTRVILFAANFGQHRAILAGFAYARGRYLVTLDADLQNPPEEMSRVVAELDAGHDYVGTIRRQRQDVAWRRWSSRVINAIRERTTRIRITDHGCMFRGYSRGIVDAINQCSENNTFVPALAYTFASNPTEIDVRHEDRSAGESKYSMYQLIKLNFDLMTGFSTVPMQLFSAFGFGVSVLSVLFGIGLVVRRIVYGANPGEQGVFTLFAIAFLLIGVTLFGLGLLGEYIGRIYEEVRRRPRYIIGAVLERAPDPP